MSVLTYLLTLAIYTQRKQSQRRRKLQFVLFDIRALWRSGLSVRVPGCQKLQMAA